MKAIANTLTPVESQRLGQLETVISAGLGNFVAVGNALIEVSDSRLYREQFSTFEDYCREKWQMSARQAYRLCEGAEIIKALPESATKLVAKESQARELKRVPKEKRAKVIEVAAETAKAESRPMTARDIKVAANPEPVAENRVGETAPEPDPKPTEQDQIALAITDCEPRFHKLLDRYSADVLPYVRNSIRTILAKSLAHDCQFQR